MDHDYNMKKTKFGSGMYKQVILCVSYRIMYQLCSNENSTRVPGHYKN